MIRVENAAMQIVALMTNGNDPGIVLNVIDENSYHIRQMRKMLNGKTPDQLRTVAKSINIRTGTTTEDMARQMGIEIPSNR